MSEAPICFFCHEPLGRMHRWTPDECAASASALEAHEAYIERASRVGWTRPKTT